MRTAQLYTDRSRVYIYIIPKQGRPPGNLERRIYIVRETILYRVCVWGWFIYLMIDCFFILYRPILFLDFD